LPDGEHRGGIGIDYDLVVEWLADSGIEAQPPFQLRRLGDGKSNLTYLLSDADGRRMVLRRPPLGRLLPSAHDVAREYRVLSSLIGTGVPIPSPIAIRPRDERLDVPLLLMEHVSGSVIDGDEALASVGPERRRAIGLSLARTLATVHAVDIEAVGLADLASHKPLAARQLRRWRHQFEDSKTRELPLVEELADRLEAKAPEQQEVRLVHGDYHLLNAITDPADGKVRAILDWELCTLGDPLADIGGLLAYWPEADDSVAPAPHALTTFEGFPSRAELTDAYAEATGRDIAAVGFWETLGCWKVAIICEGILRRRIDEPRNGDPAEAAELAVRMLDRAMVAAERSGL
jgi:aminoglycoside phosphotransferase (APT) family kinase protein